MTLKERMNSNPNDFRRMLRKVLAETLPVVTAASLMVGCGQSITIIPSEFADNKRDGTISVLDAGREQPPEQINPPPDTPNSKWDFSRIPKENQMESCPVSPCGSNDIREAKGTYIRKLTASDPTPLSQEQCMKLCKQDIQAVCPSGSGIGTHYSVKVDSCSEEVDRAQQKGMVCEYTISRSCVVAGRRPAGMQDTQEEFTVQTDKEVAGSFFAELAYLEEAAVTAFQYLTKELEAYQAPEELIALSRRAIQEEVEHAEMMQALTKRYDGQTRTVEVEPFALRPLAEIAFENAREGCTREAYGSLMAMWQAEMSEDPAVRAVMHRIAYEESAHAALSFAIDEWIRPQLSHEEQQRYDQLQQESLASLQQELIDEPSPILVQWAGYPPQEVGLQLFQKLQQELTA